MSRRTLQLALLSVLLLLAACSDDGPIIVTVDVVSDWSPGFDFVSIETSISSEPLATSGAEVRQESFTATGSEDFLGGVRVAELDDVGEGRRFVRVQLRDAGGRTIAARMLDVTLTQSFAATLLITRSCRDVECPAPAGAPELSECQAGECVDPRCSPSSPEFCSGPTCESDAQCVALLDWCEGTALCGVTSHCLCDEAPPAVDSGMVVDTGPDVRPTEAVCNDGLDDDSDGATDCEDSDCLGAACDDGRFCTTNETCGADLTCSVSEPTCPAFCNESTSRCEECGGDGDCGPVTMGMWSGCSGFTGGVCDETGSRTRTITTPRCTSGMCTFPTSPETGSCSRSTTGTACNDGNPCTGPDRCRSGTCSDTPAQAQHSTCGSSNLRCCGGSCVDIRTSTSHCGGCGLRCTGMFTCMSRGGLPTCDCNTARSDCAGSTNHCSGMSSLCSCDSTFGGVCPAPMRCIAMTGGADICTY